MIGWSKADPPEVTACLVIVFSKTHFTKHGNAKNPLRRSISMPRCG
jgi:hypothetical protein